MILKKVYRSTSSYMHLHLSALKSILDLNSQITIANNLVTLIVAYYKPINIILHSIEGVFLGFNEMSVDVDYPALLYST